MTKKIVLIVEDNPLNMRLFTDLLKTIPDVEVHQVDHSIEALDRIKEHSPDLILMDIHMPGLSGLDVTRSIRETEEVSSIPVIAVTAGNKDDRENLLKVGFDDHILKPIVIPDFLSKVKEFLKI